MYCFDAIALSDESAEYRKFLQIDEIMTTFCGPTGVSLGCGRVRRKSNSNFRTPSLNEVLAYRDQDIVARIAREAHASFFKADGMFQDALRFLWVYSKVQRPLCPPPRIDIAWHVFILFTKEYREFCDKYFGFFIDHSPRRRKDGPFDEKLAHETLNLSRNLLSKNGPFNLSKNWGFEQVESASGCCT